MTVHRWIRGPRHRLLPGAAALAAASMLVACSSPGSGGASDADTTVDPDAISTDVGDEEVEITLYDGAGLKAIDDALIAAFTEQYPNITVKTRFDPDDVQAQNAPRVLASDDPPDIARINALSDIVGNNQLTNLDPYAEAYGWTELPEGQLAMYRVDDDGVRGSGSQYTVASGFVLTGIYYNKDVAQELGVEPPTTVEDLESTMATAKDAGVTPIMSGNQTGGATFAVQMMMNNTVGKQPINDWVFNVPDATVDTPEALAAVEIVNSWVDNGYFNDDANGTDGTVALGRFVKGESLYFFSGSWDASALQDQMGDKVGFVLAPVAEGGSPLGMSDPVSNFGIPAKSDQKDAAAAFLNFLLSPDARQIVVDTGAGPSGIGETPETEPDTLKAEVQEAFTQLVEADGQVQFVQNATSGINADWLAQTQELLAGRVSPADYLANIQGAYEEQLQ